MRGFNKSGIYRMKQFYETYKDFPFVSPLVTQIRKYSIKTLRGYKFYEILSRFMGSDEKLEVSTRVKSLKKTAK